MEDDISCSFLSVINDTFLRTNRSSGQKSLRYGLMTSSCLEMLEQGVFFCDHDL